MNPAWKKIQEDLVETVRILIKQEKEKGGRSFPSNLQVPL